MVNNTCQLTLKFVNENVSNTDGKMMNVNPGGPLCRPSNFPELPNFLLIVS